MLRLLSGLARGVERLISAPFRASRYLSTTLMFNPRLGRLRWVVAPILLYFVFAVALTYVYAPIRGMAGQVWMGRVLTYADERSLGTAIYDVDRRFVGILDPILDSEQDFNYTGRPIILPDYIAYPDHKSLHVAEVPSHYWRCLRYQEDRHLGGLLNPFGIDLLGVLKIPVTTVRRSVEAGWPALGVGGSTIPMQLARTFFKTPPSRDESPTTKLGRKLKEWWLAPVIYWELTEGNDPTRLQLWAANHFPLAQRTGGQELYGVEQTSLILFGKSATELSPAKQYVLAAAVNQPVILLAGSEAMERTQTATWQRIVGKRARQCAEALVHEPDQRAQVNEELTRLAERAPTPAAAPEILEALATLSSAAADVARANPVQRSNVLLPSVRYGVREELKERFGFGWRQSVRSVHLTLDAADNFRFGERIETTLAGLQVEVKRRLAPHYSLDLRALAAGQRAPDIILAAADENGRLIRYFESNQTAAYFGSEAARDKLTGAYRPTRETRSIASVGKMLAGIAIADEARDQTGSAWLDTRAPSTGLEACKKGLERRLRSAEVAFACSLNAPLEWRTAQVPLERLKKLVRDFDVATLDPTTSAANLAKSIVVGQVAASPRNVQRIAGSVLASLTDRTGAPRPTLIGSLAMPDALAQAGSATAEPRPPLVKAQGRAVLKDWLSAPLCYPGGTLDALGDWCAARRRSLRLHFAKTGTRGTGTADPVAPDTVDLWVAGGVGFASGPAYSYVLLIGSGNPSDPWARDLYAGSVAQSLIRVLLEDLEEIAARPSARLSKATSG